jgi:nucleoid-associated protein YgaU
MSRFSRRKIYNNRLELYEQLAEERDTKYFRQFETPRLRYPTAKEISEFSIRKHVWKSGDKFYKLAHEYYGDSKLWWVIAWYNKTPTESHVPNGSVLSIPLPIQKVLKYLRNE